MATIRYNEDRSQCDVTLDSGIEFGPLDTSQGGILVLDDDEHGKQFILVVSDEVLDEDEVYELTPVGAEVLGEEDEEEDEEEDVSGTNGDNTAN